MLTVAQCKAATPADKPIKLFDSGGLHLLVLPSGVKSWRLKYRFAGKERQLVFGHFPEISLADARGKRDEARRALADGLDPSAKASEARARRAGTSAPGYTFKQAALRWHKLQAHGWKPRHAQDVLGMLEADAFPALGALPIAEILPADIRPIVDAMQERGAVDQAHRMLMRISRIFQLAVVDEKATADPAAPLSAILRPVPKRKYSALLIVAEARAGLIQLEGEAHWPSLKMASRLLALTASRPGPIRFARPEEFTGLDGPDPLWTIPADKLKLELAESLQDNFAFQIPLSKQAVELVKVAIKEAGERPWLFPAPQSGHKALCDAALSQAYRRTPRFAGRHVPHGWRSTFSTVMNERAIELGNPGDRAIIDLMLAHKPSGVESRYNRAAYMPRRRELAQEWADLLCEGLAPAADLIEGPRN